MALVCQVRGHIVWSGDERKWNTGMKKKGGGTKREVLCEEDKHDMGRK